MDDAEFRPMGIAFSPKGGMFIGDTKKGRIWKIEYYGDKNRFNSEDLVEMEMRKLSSHIRTPDEEKDKIEIGTDYEYKDGILFKLRLLTNDIREANFFASSSLYQASQAYLLNSLGDYLHGM